MCYSVDKLVRRVLQNYVPTEEKKAMFRNIKKRIIFPILALMATATFTHPPTDDNQPHCPRCKKQPSSLPTHRIIPYFIFTCKRINVYCSRSKRRNSALYSNSKHPSSVFLTEKTLRRVQRLILKWFLLL